MAEYQIYNENNMETLARMADNSLDAVVTDAPYGLGKEPDPLSVLSSWITTGYYEIIGKGFMGKEWDAFVPQPAFWKEVYRVLKPGGYVLCFFGSRTYDWGTLAIRVAGFEIRDCIQWIYGSGFPKSLDVSKAIDKMGEENEKYSQLSEDLCKYLKASREKMGLSQKDVAKHFPSKNGGLTGCVWNWENGMNVPTIEQWPVLKEVLNLIDERFNIMIERAIIKRIEAEREVVGYREHGFIPGGNKVYGKYSGDKRITAAATEPAQHWDGYGTALKPAHEPICVARKPLDGTVAENVLKYQCGAINLNGCRIGDTDNMGRFPANIILDETAAAILDDQSGQLTSGKMPAGTLRHNRTGYTGPMPNITGAETYGDTGGASRFFYCAKASRADRDYGCEGMEFKEGGLKSNTSGQHIIRRDGFMPSPLRNNHPTVKPIALMRYLVRLVKTPFDTCTIMDPFMGSGTTGIACMLEGINFYGCESEKDSYDIAAVRIEYAKQEYLKEGAKPKQGDLFIL